MLVKQDNLTEGRAYLQKALAILNSWMKQAASNRDENLQSAGSRRDWQNCRRRSHLRSDARQQSLTFSCLPPKADLRSGSTRDLREARHRITSCSESCANVLKRGGKPMESRLNALLTNRRVRQLTFQAQRSNLNESAVNATNRAVGRSRPFASLGTQAALAARTLAISVDKQARFGCTIGAIDIAAARRASACRRSNCTVAGTG